MDAKKPPVNPVVPTKTTSAVEALRESLRPATDVDAMHPVRERISLLNVPIDIVPEDQLPYIINGLVQSGEAQNIVLLSLWDLLRARRNGEYRSYIMSAALVVPISSSIVQGSRFLTGKKVPRYMPFNFIVKLLIILEERELSVYLLGGKPKILKKTEKNIRETFPRLHIVGRYESGFRKHEAPAIIEAIRKTAASLLLVGKGVTGEERWIARHSSRLNQGLRLWCSDLYDVFAKRKPHPSQFSFDHGLDWAGFCVHNPLRIFRVFLFLWYNALLLVYRLFKKKK